MYQKKPGPVRLVKTHRLSRIALVLAPVVGLAALIGVLLFGGLVHTVSGACRWSRWWWRTCGSRRARSR